MAAVVTSLPIPGREAIVRALDCIRSVIPVGFSHHPLPQEWIPTSLPDFDLPVFTKEYDSLLRQIGTLGGGNHFIEIQADEHDRLCFMLHSGSRNFGLKVANFYHECAKDECSRWYSDIPDPDLAFLPRGHKLYDEYRFSMDVALEFAQESRKRMMDIVVRAFGAAGSEEERYDVYHNYARMEAHFGRNVMVHRKGATSARLGEYGIIPGSQGTMSHIVRGLGNPESFMSCSHGAGRKMGRKQAQRELSLVGEIKRMDDAGIIHSIRTDKDLDEAAGAYKDIGTVMDNQTDLVEIVHTLRPLAVIKA